MLCHLVSERKSSKHPAPASLGTGARAVQDGLPGQRAPEIQPHAGQERGNNSHQQQGRASTSGEARIAHAMGSLASGG